MALHQFKKNPFIKRSSAFASLECRFAAFLIDSCLFIFFQTFANYLLVGYPTEEFAVSGFAFAHLSVFYSDLDYLGRLLYTNLLLIIFHWLYYALMESSPLQATVGKFVLGLKVTDMDGEAVGFAQATVRYFGKFLSISILFTGFLVAYFNYRHQTLHDLISQCTIRMKTEPFYLNKYKQQAALMKH